MRYASIVALLMVLVTEQAPTVTTSPNYGKIWASWPASLRDQYLAGFQDGWSTAYLAAAQHWLRPGELYPETKRVTAVREQLALFLDLGSIRDVVTNLYADPANQFIPFPRVIHMARDKLQGKNIDSALRQARKRAFEDYMELERMRQK